MAVWAYRTTAGPSAMLAAMVFGQQSGPPAPAKQVQELLSLLEQAGHDGFRDARGPMGFTQRQAAGKFTRDEVAVFIERLQEAEQAGAATPGSARAASGPRPASPRSAADRAVAAAPSPVLAAELLRRGWTVIEP
ncbi:MAG: hypothetical protein QOG64_326 [Acidimicrobiaceae bacterium]|nr:hypothetical protein [Acidimicrobiaceae bacterium]